MSCDRLEMLLVQSIPSRIWGKRRAGAKWAIEDISRSNQADTLRNYNGGEGIVREDIP
jgi:hypothetical protein